MGIFKSVGKIAPKNVAAGGEQTPQQSTNNSASIQPAEAPRESFSQPSTVSTGGQSGTLMSKEASRIAGNLGSMNTTNGWDQIRQTRSQGGVLGTQGAQPYASDYDSQSSAQSMIQAPSVGDGGLAASSVNTGSQYGGPNRFGSFGNSKHQGIPNGLAASMYSRGNRFDVNQTIHAPGQYNVIDGAQLI